MPRPKLNPPLEEQHDHRPHLEEDEEKESEANGMFRRDVTTPPGAPRVPSPSEVLLHDVEAAAAASAKTFPMWLGETRQSCVLTALTGAVARSLCCLK